MNTHSIQCRPASWSQFSSLVFFVRTVFFVLFVGALTIGAAAANNVSLRGSAASLDEQNNQAERHNFTFLRESSQLRKFVEAGLLVPIGDSRNYRLKDVSFPYARPEVKLFIERLSEQYRRACGEQLVITSLTRPLANQPRNASPRSVHPTGMAIDVRRPSNPTCRRWLENVLLYLEAQLVIEATRERAPPHYHVAVFARAYADYVRLLKARSSSTTSKSYIVRRRDTLWKIARRHGTTPPSIQRLNGLKSSLIRPGQVLMLPPGTVE